MLGLGLTDKFSCKPAIGAAAREAGKAVSERFACISLIAFSKTQLKRIAFAKKSSPKWDRGVV